MVRRVVISIDDSKHSRAAVDWAFTQLHLRNDMIHLCTVLPPPTQNIYPVAPVGTAAAVTAVQHTLHAQKHAEEVSAAETLKLAEELISIDYKVPRENIQRHVLPPAGGASGVADSIVEFVRAQRADMVVVGSRGMGSIKRSLMSFLGLGSVSDALLHTLTCPVVVVGNLDGTKEKAQQAEAIPPPTLPVSKRVCVSYDDSPHSQHALVWAIDHVLQPHDHLHIITVAPNVAFPILDEPAAAMAMATQQYQQETEASASYAHRLCEQASEAAALRGVTKTKIVTNVLTPVGGASDVGQALCTYAKEQQIDILVAGSRGMGALQRSFLGIIGLGSVSDYLAHHLHCALAVIKAEPASGAAGGGDGDGEGALQRPSLSVGDNIAFQPIHEEGSMGPEDAEVAQAAVTSMAAESEGDH